MVVDEFGKDAVHSARGDAQKVCQLGGGEALLSQVPAGMVEERDDTQTHAGFPGQVQELLIDRAIARDLRIEAAFRHGDRGREILTDEVGLIPACTARMAHGHFRFVAGIVCHGAVADADGNGECGGGGDDFQKREVLVLIGRCFKQAAGEKKHIVIGRPFDAGGVK